jgi:hypothetical protein
MRSTRTKLKVEEQSCFCLVSQLRHGEQVPALCDITPGISVIGYFLLARSTTKLGTKKNTELDKLGLSNYNIDKFIYSFKPCSQR